MNDDQIRMMPEDFGAMEWKDVTNVHPVALVVLVILGVAVLLLPRRWALLPVIIMACFIPTVQKISVFALDFSLMRIVILVAAIRIGLHGEHLGLEWRPVDKLILWYAASATLIYTMQTGTISALINRLGFSFDILGTYFVTRCFIRTWDDVDRLILGCAVISVPVAAAFAVEYSTQRNAFSIFGGVPTITMVRDGKLRCQGAFSHPILAGCFWAALVPLFASMWWRNPAGRRWAVAGVLSATFIIFACHSSTPLSGLVAAGIGGLAFLWRHKMRTIRWTILIALIVLHLVKERPVWSLIDVASGLGGGGGYHRYKLVDGAITHVGEWWLLGTTSTAHWFWGAQDVTVQYVLEAVQGGVLTLALFVAIIVLCFRAIGNLWRLHGGDDHYRIAVSWALGVSLLVHCMNFLGVSYFGQITFLWYLLLGAIGSLSPAVAQSRGGAKRAAEYARWQAAPTGQVEEAVSTARPDGLW